MNNTTIEIPQEFNTLCNLSQTFYIYLDRYCNGYRNHYQLLLNPQKSKHSLCYGAVTPDEHNRFDISENTAKAVAFSEHYRVFIEDGCIYVHPCKKYKSSSLNVIVPQEILNLCCVDFNKPTYLCTDGNDYYLTNNYSSSRRYRYTVCYGTIQLGQENDIELSPNICNTLEITSPLDIIFCTDFSKILVKVIKEGD